MLVESGIDAVRIMTLARTLGLSRTSFYWHFADREALLDAPLERWRTKNTAGLIGRTERYAGSITEAVFNLFDCWITPELFDARLDFSIRNWARSDPALEPVVAKADADRIDAIRAMYSRHGYTDDQADIRARTVYLTQVGYISMMVEEPIETRLARMPAYVEAFTAGSSGGRRRALHGATPADITFPQPAQPGFSAAGQGGGRDLLPARSGCALSGVRS